MTAERATVLVADDDEDILTLVSLRLERAGYEIVRASDGDQALRLVRERRPSLAVLDVTMPKLTGYEVTERLRADEATRDLPVILLTARVQEGDIARGLAAGATDYVTKPFDPADLRKRVEAALRR